MSFTINLATALVSNTTSTSTSGSFTPAVGEYLVAIGTAGASSTVASTPAISDSQAGSWTLVQLANLSSPGGGGGGGSCGVWYRAVSSATSMTVTTTGSGGTINQSSIQVYRCAGTNGIQFGASGKGSATTGTTNITPTAYTSTINGSTMVVGFTEWTGGRVMSSTDLTLTSYSSNQEGGGGFKTLGTPGSQTFNLQAASSGGFWFWVAMEIAELSPKTATETGTGSDTASTILVSLSAADTSSAADAPGTSQGKGDVDVGHGIDLGQLNGIPISAADSTSGADAMSALSALIFDHDGIQGTDGGNVVVPPVQIHDYESALGLDFPRRVGKGPYRLSLPYTEGWRADHAFFRRIPVHRGLSLLRIGGIFQLIQDPTFEDLMAADRIYLGGYDNWVTDDEAQDLGNAGWASYIQGFTFVPDAYYGSGQYGASVYGN